MKRHARQLVLVAVLVLSGAFLMEVRAETETIDLKALAKKARPAVMLLVVSDANGKEIATGTGFLVSSHGKLITNNHVVDNAASAVAKAENGGLFPVEGVLAYDRKNDLVLLKLKGKDLPFLTLSTNATVEAGTRIAVIGSPLGLEGTLTEGIVSAVRDVTGDTRMLQITAAISPGSSGSPVLNAKGEVIGVARSLLREGQALNFAAPAEVVCKLVASATDKPTFPLAALADLNFLLSEEHQEAVHAFMAEDWVRLRKASQAQVRRFPDEVDGYFLLGRACDELGFYDEAIGAWRQAIKLKPDNADYWFALGMSCDLAGKYDDGIAAYHRAIKLKPDDAGVWQQLGYAYHDQNKYDEATIAFRQAIKLKPDDAHSWYALGNIYLLQGKRQEALDALDHLRKLDPSRADKLEHFLLQR
jgi:cytochrome c-type biogenesis protein CcmH/NrfG